MTTAATASKLIYIKNKSHNAVLFVAPDLHTGSHTSILLMTTLYKQYIYIEDYGRARTTHEDTPCTNGDAYRDGRSLSSLQESP